MIERTLRGVWPATTITAPLPLRRDAHDESLRLATFRQSDGTRNGVVAPFPRPASVPTPHPRGR